MVRGSIAHDIKNKKNKKKHIKDVTQQQCVYCVRCVQGGREGGSPGHWLNSGSPDTLIIRRRGGGDDSSAVQTLLAALTDWLLLSGLSYGLQPSRDPDHLHGVQGDLRPLHPAASPGPAGGRAVGGPLAREGWCLFFFFRLTILWQFWEKCETIINYPHSSFIYFLMFLFMEKKISIIIIIIIIIIYIYVFIFVIFYFYLIMEILVTEIRASMTTRSNETD